MNAVEIEAAVSELAEKPFDSQEFAYDFLRAFGNKETTIKKLRAGQSNSSDIQNGVLQRNYIHIAVCDQDSVTQTLNALRESKATEKAKAKFILATDGLSLQAEDLISGETISSEFSKFAEHFGFFLPLAGISTIREIKDNPIDVRATGRLNKLYIELLKENPDWATEERRQDMNHFMARLIFCFFAEDTEIFQPSGIFTQTIEQMSERDSSNTHEVISTLFHAMNVDFSERVSTKLPVWARKFPYVNGGLFSGSTEVPKFSKIARTYLLHAGELNWQKINPDIFGSMIQAVTNDDERGSLGMHYTSVPNILKVLNPLFLDDLKEQLEASKESPLKLLNLRKRIARIRVFDPACGSGNFLVIAYKELRKIEAQINKLRNEEGRATDIPLTNFRGIEINSFPAEIARLALVIAEYQSNVQYCGQIEALQTVLPLSKENWIICGNSIRLDWLSVCPPTGSAVKLVADDLFESPIDQVEIDFENEGGEIYICGNPPFAGQKKKNDAQREDMKFYMSKYMSSFGELDYVTAFYLKAAEYCKYTQASAALVSTNSVVQGRHVPTFWPIIFDLGCEISFAYTSFPWSNNAANNASVYCVIIGLRQANNKKKYIFNLNEKIEANKINGYLIDFDNVIVEKRKKPLSLDLQVMRSGNMPLDGGNLFFSHNEIEYLKANSPEAMKFVKRVVGAKEINQGLIRYCLWIEDNDLDAAINIGLIKEKIELCKEFRKTSSAPKLAETPHAFRDRHTQSHSAIILPNLSSEKRQRRIPILVKDNVIPTNLALAIYDGEIFQIAILASRLHHLWVEAVCGKLKQDYRYSNDLGWHTFPLHKLTSNQKVELATLSEELLLAIESEYPSTLNDIYNNGMSLENLPNHIFDIHKQIDDYLERIYIGRRFKNDTERLEKLFSMYTEMTSKQAGKKKA